MLVMTIYHKEKRNKNKEHIDFYMENLSEKNHEQKRRKLLCRIRIITREVDMSIYRLVKLYSNRSETPYSNNIKQMEFNKVQKPYSKIK